MSTGHHKEYDLEPGVEGHNGQEASERVGLLSGSQQALPITGTDYEDGRRLTVNGGTNVSRYTLKHLLASFAGGVTACLAVQLSLYGIRCYSTREGTGSSGANADKVNVYAPPWVGSTSIHEYPPPAPTNNNPELFPTKYVRSSTLCTCLLGVSNAMSALDIRGQPRRAQNRVSLPPRHTNPSKQEPRSSSHPHTTPSRNPSLNLNLNPRYLATVRSTFLDPGETCRLGTAFRVVRLGLTKVRSLLRSVRSRACTCYIVMGRDTLPVCPHFLYLLLSASEYFVFCFS